jgi:adenylate cyclase
LLTGRRKCVPLVIDMSPGPFGSRLLGPADQDQRSLRLRIQVLLTVLLVGAHLTGALVVVVLSNVVIPGPELNDRTWSVVVIGVPVYVAIGIVAGGTWGTTRALRVLRWALNSTTMTKEDRRATLRIPTMLTLMQAFWWGLATVIFSVLFAILQPEQVFTVGFTVSFAGVVVCANAYLLTEFALRPVSARALDGEPLDRVRGAGVQARMLLFWSLGTGVPVAGLVVTGVLAIVRDNFSVDQLAITVIVIGVMALFFGSLVMIFTARSIVAPIHSVRAGMARVRHGGLNAEVTVYDGTELGQLQDGFNRMAAGLRERERIRDLFGRHVGHAVANEALADGTDTLGGEVREVSMIFVDLVGSTTLAANRPPTEVVELLNRFFTVIVDEVDAHGGFVNKFVGDAALAVFGAPVTLADHAGRALAAARAIAARLPAEVPECAAGIGVASGPAVAGNIGDRRRFEYTVIGDPVNEAARLTELAKSVPGMLVASARAAELAAPEEAEHWHPLDEVTLRGRTEATTVVVPGGPPERPNRAEQAATTAE